MPAPTALQRAPEDLTESPLTISATPAVQTPNADDDEMLLATSTPLPTETMDLDLDHETTTTTTTPSLFAPEKHSRTTLRVEERKIRIPSHRLTPLKASWPKIYPPLVEHLKLQVRMNLAKKMVELRTSPSTTDPSAIQKGQDFLTAFTYGFDLADAIALLRLDDLYIQSFLITDVKRLEGEHLSRAIGRVAGKDGKTKFAIENASRTRVVLEGQRVHILGGFRNLGVAREAVVSLILGSPPGKVYGNLRTVSRNHLNDL